MYDKRFISQILYQLKRDFGEKLIIITPGDQSVDLDTGLVSDSATAVEVERAIVLPEQMDSSFQYALPFIASSKNFTHGGIFETIQRRILIDEKDIDIEINTENYVVLGTVRYDVLKADQYTGAWWITAKQASDIVPHTIKNVKVGSTLHLEGVADDSV